MGDPLGIYYGPGGTEQGLAQVIPRVSNERPFDVIERQQAGKAAAEAAQRDAAAKQLKDIGTFDAGRFSHDLINQEYNNLIDGVMSGEYDSYEVQRRVQALSQMSEASQTLETEYDTFHKGLKEEDGFKVDEWRSANAAQIMSGGSGGLMSLQHTPLDYHAPLAEPGSSDRLLDSGKMVKTVIDSNFDEMLENSTYDPGNWASLGPGTKVRDDMVRSSKMRLFAVDTGDGIEVKPWESLQGPVLDTFKSNPYTAAIIRDKAMEMAGVTDPNELNEQQEAKALRELLIPYVSGEKKEIQKTTLGRYYVDSRGRGEQRASTKEDQWLRDWAAGDREAAAQLRRTPIDVEDIEGIDFKWSTYNPTSIGNMDDLRITRVDVSGDEVTIGVTGTATGIVQDNDGKVVHREGDVIRDVVRFSKSNMPENVRRQLYRSSVDENGHYVPAGDRPGGALDNYGLEENQDNDEPTGYEDY